jgi:hypothetical protein
MWIAALALAAVLITYSTWLYVKANPDSRLPWVGRAIHEPGAAVMTRLAGIFVGLVGGTALTPDDERGWFGLGVLLMMVPTVFLQTRHNARVKS